MKKFTAILLSALLCVSLAGCGNNDSTNTNAASDSATKTPTSTSAPADTSATDTTSNDSTATGEVVTGITGSVTAAGSSALLPLAQAASESFMQLNPDCSVIVNGGGSGNGLKQVADKAVDIGNSDVFAAEKLDAAVAETLVDHKVCTMHHCHGCCCECISWSKRSYYRTARWHLYWYHYKLERSRRTRP